MWMVSAPWPFDPATPEQQATTHLTDSDAQWEVENILEVKVCYHSLWYTVW
jgi:hypothetical protein